MLPQKNGEALYQHYHYIQGIRGSRIERSKYRQQANRKFLVNDHNGGIFHGDVFPD